MGSGQSTDDQDMSGETHGYHVMQVVPNSPASKAGLEIFFDYITHVNGLRLDREPIVLASQLRSNIGKPVNLVVYSSKTLGARNVTVVPEKNDYGILGCSVRFCDFGDVHDHIWHIIEVHANSPAEIAGLREKSDYIIGTPNTTLEEKDDFYNLVKKHANIPLQLYVYNSDSDSIREVLIVPNNDWDGEGLLGCDVGHDHNMITDTSLKQDQQSQSHETAEEFDEKSITELHHLLQAVELQTSWICMRVHPHCHCNTVNAASNQHISQQSTQLISQQEQPSPPLIHKILASLSFSPGY
ncbi:hypothetical protein BDV3_001267 [Batrachochytrium dendrobatidis]